MHSVELLEFLLEGLGLLVVRGGPTDRLMHLRGDQESEDELVVAEEAHGHALEEDGPEFPFQLGSSEPRSGLPLLAFSQSQALDEEVPEPPHREAIHRVKGCEALDGKEQPRSVKSDGAVGLARVFDALHQVSGRAQLVGDVVGDSLGFVERARQGVVLEDVLARL